MKQIFTILGLATTLFASAQTTFNYVAANQGFTNSQVLTTGNIVAGKLTYEVLKNGATTAPAYFTSGTNIRLYSSLSNGNGSSYDIKAAAGVKINTVKIKTPGTLGTDNYAPTSAVITVDGVKVPTVYDPADTTNATYLVNTTAPASSVKIQNGQTGTAAAQVRIVSIEITYTDALAVGDVNATKVSLVKNTIVANEIIFGEAAKVTVTNMAGQVVKTADVAKDTKLNVSELAKGTYIVTGTVNGKSVSQKVIKK